MGLDCIWSIILVLILVTCCSGRPATFDESSFLGVFRTSLLETLDLATSTRPQTDSDEPEMIEWRLNNLDFLAKNLERHLEVTDHFNDPENSVQTLALGDDAYDDLMSDEDKTNWLLILNVFKKMILDDRTEDFDQEENPAGQVRRARAIFSPPTDYISSQAPKVATELINNVVVSERHGQDRRLRRSLNTRRRRRSLSTVVGALGHSLTKLGGLKGLAVLLANTTLYNFISSYIYSMYQMYFAHSTERIDEKRRLHLSVLVCLAAREEGLGSLPENAGCLDILNGDNFQHFENKKKLKLNKQQRVDKSLVEPSFRPTRSRTSSVDGRNTTEERLYNTSTASGQEILSIEDKALIDDLGAYT